MEYVKNLKDFGFKTNNQVFVIAELGINHGGSIETARNMIDSVSRTGADAVKFQTYLTEKRVPKDSPIFNVLKKCELSFVAFAELKEYARSQNLDFFSTPFDFESVDFLNSIDCDLYKIASFDVVNHKFLKKVAKNGKPVLMSVGMSSLKEIHEAYKILRSEIKDVAILHCISSYPTQENAAHLSAIFKLKEEFDCIIGQSDHTNDIRVPVYAVAAGAQILEKHFKIDDSMECVDSAVSITEIQMTKLVKEVRAVEKILGNPEFGVRQEEKGIEQYRRFS